MPRGVPNSGKRNTRKKEEKPDFSLTPKEKVAAAKELEGMFNICAEHGQMPSDTIFRLVQWLGSGG